MGFRGVIGGLQWEATGPCLITYDGSRREDPHRARSLEYWFWLVLITFWTGGFAWAVGTPHFTAHST